MKTKIQKWGNSRAVRIPLSLATEGHFELGSDVEMKLKGGELIIIPIQKKRKLRELLAGVNRDNLHSETDTGGAVGGEIW